MSISPRSKRLLYIDDDLPVRSAGSGMPRTREILRGLLRLGYEITYIPLQSRARATKAARDADALQLEVPDLTNQSLEEFIETRRGYFGCVFVSRPHNMAAVYEIRQKRPELFEGTELIYDAEAIFARREILKSEILGLAALTVDPSELLHTELTFARDADRVIAVSPLELEEFRAAGVTKVNLLAHAVDLVPTSRTFGGRQHFLFVGRLEENDSPNVDSVVWFATEVLPVIDRLAGSAPHLVLVGRANAPRIRALNGPRVNVIGEIEDVRPWYETCRVFVAPTRFSAGIPLKVCEAAAAGIPVVATDLVFAQLGWQVYPELRSGTTASEFAGACVEVYMNETLWQRIREIELELVEKAFSRPVFNCQLEQIFGS